jgi:DtxR family Mn-dependent transcriptional regulator
VPKAYSLTLANIKIGTKCRVVAVKDTGSEFLQYLVKLNIGIGTKIDFLEQISFDQSLVISINGEEKITVSQKFGESILVS